MHVNSFAVPTPHPRLDIETADTEDACMYSAPRWVITVPLFPVSFLIVRRLVCLHVWFFR